MARIKIKTQSKKRRETKGMLFVTLLFFILFPYIISGFSKVEKQSITLEAEPGRIWVLEEKIWGGRKIPLEDYLIGMVAATIPAEYTLETLKAQAIILRSFSVTYMEKEEGKKIIKDRFLREYYLSEQNCEQLWSESAGKHLQKIKQAVEETKGIVMVCEGDVIKPPFCRMTNGSTRDITEYVVHKELYDYMKSVSCKEDEMAEDAVQYVEMTQKEFEETIRKKLGVEDKNLDKITIYKDSLNYVKTVEIGEVQFDGEEFRKAFGLNSSSYSLEKINNNIEIQTRGIGHGYGFSQHTANERAKNGNNYKDLLTYFFSNISLEKI